MNENSAIEPRWSGVTFGQTGNRFMYSNNPEFLYNNMGTALGNLGNSNVDGLYTVETTLALNQEYVAEWYHHVPTGTTTYRIGVAIYNDSSTPKSFRWTNAAKKYASQSSVTANVGAELFPAYYKSTNDQYVDVPANQTKVFFYDDVPVGNLSVGRVKFYARSTGLKARIFCIKKNKITDANHVFRLPKALDSGNGVSSGLYLYDTRTLTRNFSDIHQGIKLSAFGAYNSNEYEPGQPGYIGPQLRQGNYGIQYDISIPGSAGKKMRIWPTLDGSAAGPYGRIVLKTSAAGGWYTTTLIKNTDTKKYWDFTMPSDAKFSFNLPGGNNGQVLFEFV